MNNVRNRKKATVIIKPEVKIYQQWKQLKAKLKKPQKQNKNNSHTDTQSNLKMNEHKRKHQNTPAFSVILTFIAIENDSKQLY